ncbi:tRNA1(Val) (adenine(37)-N6)-methyltransferase [uncultured Limosilactobacillus sp.]|uniref:tRNA1(Val) (adenine(37)-N6)-methyltransferase n=1 Tax=uncultured Limosilactobacillus sp. TaxID=2837629 RepID=UPI0025E3FD81|nr:tRNA1(Val) (adenine(37)-N6)-methyltransferase [uncultured Limosilactobacillus sp.]
MTKESTLLQAGERVDELPAADIKIIQSDQVFAFSLDAVILAYFVRPNHRHRLKVVDLCAGNGAVGLFLHEKLGGHFTEIEIQPRLAEMAQRSIELNDLADRYRVVTDDLANVYRSVPKDSADIVVCNPPYFTDLPQSEKNPNPYLAVARHEIKTNLSTVVDRMSGLLKMNGHAYLVHRPSRLTEILAKLAAARLVPKRLQFVYPRSGRDANMVVIEAIKDGKPGGLKVNAPLIVHQGQDYSPAVKEMLYG